MPLHDVPGLPPARVIEALVGEFDAHRRPSTPRVLQADPADAASPAGDRRSWSPCHPLRVDELRDCSFVLSQSRTNGDYVSCSGKRDGVRKGDVAASTWQRSGRRADH